MRMLLRFAIGLAAIGVLMFVPSGSLTWANAWVLLGFLFVPMLAVLGYMLARDPGLIERRMRWSERRAKQRSCVAWSYPIVIPIFALPGLDHRLGWSSVPAVVEAAGAVLLLAGYALFAWVMKTNSYASRIVMVDEGQRLIDRGPYALVRHPMYSATILIYLAIPLVLGSWWALIASAAFPPFLVVRIRDEEAMLREGLEGYAEYCGRVRWRLAPLIW